MVIIGKLTSEIAMYDAEDRPFSRSVFTRGADRSGIRASSLVPEARYDNTITSPRVEYPNVLITTGRMVEQDELTAQDQAIYFYLVSRARDRVNALNRVNDAHEKISFLWKRGLSVEVPVRDIVAYTGTASLVRIRGSLERIEQARIRYDLRRPGARDLSPKRLVEFSRLPDRLTGSSVIQYTIDHAVRSAMALARHYVHVDLNAFSRFKCRYSPRLYLRLAILASYDVKWRRPWSPDTAELAEILGYPTKAFHKANFVATVGRAVKEIAGLPDINRRFDVAAAMPSSTTQRFRFAVSGTRKTLYDVRRQRVPRSVFFHAEARDMKIGLRPNQFLRAIHFGYAAEFTGKDPMQLSIEWRDDIVAANDDPCHRIGEMAGADFLALINRYGAPAAFEHWLRLKGHKSIVPVDDDIPDIEPPMDLSAGLSQLELDALVEEIDSEQSHRFRASPASPTDDIFGALLGSATLLMGDHAHEQINVGDSDTRHM